MTEAIIGAAVLGAAIFAAGCMMGLYLIYVAGRR